MGRRTRGQDHRAALDLVETIKPKGEQAAKSLGRLLNLKDQAHYGLFDVGGRDLRTALRRANELVAFAETIMQR